MDSNTRHSDWLRRYEEQEEFTRRGVASARALARTTAQRIIGRPVETDVDDPYTRQAVEQEDAADRAQLARLCRVLAVADARSETTGQAESMGWSRAQLDLLTMMETLGEDERVTAFEVNGAKRIPVYSPEDELRRLGDTRFPGRSLEGEDEVERVPDLEEDV